MEHCIIGALVSDISLAPKQLLGGRGRKREPGCWCYPLDQPTGSLRPSGGARSLVVPWLKS